MVFAFSIKLLSFYLVQLLVALSQLPSIYEVELQCKSIFFMNLSLNTVG